jgi:5-methylcytosine-specific restriction protein B
MAKSSEHDANSIYEVAKILRDRCLQADGSILWENANIWTLQNLESIHSGFVAAPDSSDRSFLEKFRDQVTPKGNDVIRLAAELVTIYFLFPSNVGQEKKLEIVGEVLGWANEALPAGNPITPAFLRGIGGGGQGYNTRRPFEIAFLIEFSLMWKRLPEQERSSALNDPWIFMDILDGLEGSETRQIRHMLLHILFPESFERIASNEHKRRIANTFTSMLDEDAPDELDRRLLAIRSKLEKLLNRRDLDFYRTPLVEVWNDQGDGPDGSAPLEVLNHKKQIILYGPPGTGKTYQADLIADRLIRPAILASFGPDKYFKNLDLVDKEIQSRIHSLQFHPAYGYEDFIRGLHINGSGGTEYRLGALPLLIDNITKDDPAIPHVLILDEINRTDLSRTLGECFSLLENRNKKIVLPGRDSFGNLMTLCMPNNLYIIGTMNLIDQSVEQIDFALRRRFLWILCPFDRNALVSASKKLWEKANSRIEWGRIESDFIKLAGAAYALNREIRNSQLLGPQYEIGHTYLFDVISFLREDIGTRPRTFLWNKGKAKRPVQQVWDLSIKPLISEYLSGLDSRSREAELARLESVFLCPPPESD